MVVPVFAGDYVFQIQSHFFQLVGKCLKPIDLVTHLLAQLALTCILDVSNQMLDSNFFSLSGANCCRNMYELAINISIGVCFLLGEVRLGWKTDGCFFLNPDNYKDGLCVVSPQYLVDIDVILPNVWSSRIPSDDLLPRIDLPHHIEHVLVKDVIEEPNIFWLVLVLFKGHGVAVRHLEHVVVSVLTH